jgi:hypothetical protein
LKNRFSEQAVELPILNVALSPKDAYKSFKIDDLCKLAESFILEISPSKKKFI